MLLLWKRNLLTIYKKETKQASNLGWMEDWREETNILICVSKYVWIAYWHCCLPMITIILQPQWQYVRKKSGIKQYKVCYNGSKKAVPQLYTVVSMWSSCAEISVQIFF